MSLSPLAPSFLPHYQSPSDLPVPRCNSTTMSLPLSQFFCRTPPLLIPSHAPPNNQPFIDGTIILLLIKRRNPSKRDAEVYQPPAGSSSILSSPLQHQPNCLQAIHRTIQQFNQHLLAEHLNRKTLQLFVLQLQNDFALLCYLIFSSVEKFPSVILPLETRLSVPRITLNLSLILIQLHSYFLAAMDQNFVVLPLRALWLHPELKQTTLQTPTFSLLPAHWKPFELRR